jgi:hypothetical protein
MPVGVGKGVNVTVLTMGTFGDASVGAVGGGDVGTVVAMGGVATLRDVSGSELVAIVGGTARGGVLGTDERVVGESVVAMVERMLVN